MKLIVKSTMCGFGATLGVLMALVVAKTVIDNVGKITKEHEEAKTE